METLVTTLHIIACLILIPVVLLQSGKGGGLGTSMGGGTSTQIFGGRGAGNFLTRVTTGLAVVFFLTSMTLSMYSSRSDSVILQAQQQEADAKEPAAGDDAADTNDADPNAAAEAAPADSADAAAPTEVETDESNPVEATQDAPIEATPTDNPVAAEPTPEAEDTGENN